MERLRHRTRSTVWAPHGGRRRTRPPSPPPTPPTGLRRGPRREPTVTFSEPVDVQPRRLSTLAARCSGRRRSRSPADPTTFILDPAADFVPRRACHLTVRGDEVTDQDAIDPPDTMTADASCTSRVAGQPPRATPPPPPSRRSRAAATAADVTGPVATRGCRRRGPRGPDPGAARLLPPGPVGRQRPRHLRRHLRLQGEQRRQRRAR